MSNKIKEYTYYVKGMHCASCEVLIEKRMLQIGEIHATEASVGNGEVIIEYSGGRPSVEQLNNIFKSDGYVFSDFPEQKTAGFDSKEFFITLGIGLLIIAGFIGLTKLGLSGLVNVDSKSSLPMFFVIGLIAGVSSCAALVGGIVLSMSKQWGELYSNTDSTWRKIQPHLMFNIGRLVSYGVLGMVLGAIGSKLNFSLKSGPILVLVVSVIMILLALQMLGFKSFRKFQFTMPKFVTRYVANESNFNGKYMPFIMGAFTFFLPCGFTITAQGIALISGNPIQGGLIMLLFALGTLPMLLFIGLSSVKLSEDARIAGRFLKVAGLLILFFAFYNINSQLNVLGLPSFNDISIGLNQPSASAQNNSSTNNSGFPQVVDGKQILKMDASSTGYSPSYFKVKAGIPVRWEVTDIGTSGCTNAVISRELFDGEIPLTPGQTSIKEFTPQNPGRYKFSCWMGMISGIIEVVSADSSSAQANYPTSSDNSFKQSGAELSGGSCSAGGGGCSCGGAR